MTEQSKEATEHPTCDRVMGIREALSTVPGITVTSEGDDVVVAPKSGPPLRLRSEAFLRHEVVTGPDGKPAVLALVRTGAERTTVIISGSDVAFEPDTSVQIGDWGGAPLQVNNAPPIVGYSEVIRDLAACEQSLDADADIDRLFGTVVMLRQFLGGAERVGIDCAGPWRGGAVSGNARPQYRDAIRAFDLPAKNAGGLSAPRGQTPYADQKRAARKEGGNPIGVLGGTFTATESPSSAKSRSVLLTLSRLP